MATNDARVVRDCALCARPCKDETLWIHEGNRNALCDACLQSFVITGDAVTFIENRFNHAIVIVPRDGIVGPWKRVKAINQRDPLRDMVIVKEEPKPKRKRRSRKNEIIAVFRELE